MVGGWTEYGQGSLLGVLVRPIQPQSDQAPARASADGAGSADDRVMFRECGGSQRRAHPDEEVLDVPAARHSDVDVTQAMWPKVRDLEPARQDPQHAQRAARRGGDPIIRVVGSGFGRGGRTEIDADGPTLDAPHWALGQAHGKHARDETGISAHDPGCRCPIAEGPDESRTNGGCGTSRIGSAVWIWRDSIADAAGRPKHREVRALACG